MIAGVAGPLQLAVENDAPAVGIQPAEMQASLLPGEPCCITINGYKEYSVAVPNFAPLPSLRVGCLDEVWSSPTQIMLPVCMPNMQVAGAQHMQ